MKPVTKRGRSANVITEARSWGRMACSKKREAASRTGSIRSAIEAEVSISNPAKMGRFSRCSKRRISCSAPFSRIRKSFRAEIGHRRTADLQNRSEDLDHPHVEPLEVVGAVENRDVLGLIAVLQVGHHADHHQIVVEKWDRAGEWLLKQRRHFLVVAVKLDPLEGAARRMLDLGASPHLTGVTPSPPGLDQSDREAVLARIEQHLVGRELAAGSVERHRPHCHRLGQAAQVQLDAERRPGLGQDGPIFQKKAGPSPRRLLRPVR